MAEPTAKRSRFRRHYPSSFDEAVPIEEEEEEKHNPLEVIQDHSFLIKAPRRFTTASNSLKESIDAANSRPEYASSSTYSSTSTEAYEAAGQKKKNTHAFIAPVTTNVKKRKHTWAAEPPPAIPLSTTDTWLTAFEEHLDYHTKQIQVELRNGQFTARWKASSDHMRDRTRNLGDLKLARLRHMLAHMGISRSRDQEQFHEAFIQACLEIIYGPDWVASSQRALKALGIKSIRHEVMIMTPR